MSDPDQQPSRYARRALVGAGLVALVAVLVVIARFEGEVLLVIYAGILLAIFLKAPAAWIASKTRLPYKACVGGLLVALLGGTAAFVAALGASLARQLGSLAEKIPEAIATVTEAAQKLPVVHGLLGGGSGDAPPPDPKLLLVGATKVVVGGTELAGALIVVLFIGLYGALDPKVYERGALLLVPRARRERAAEVLGAIDHSLTRWLLGRVVAMASVGILVSIGLAILGLPLWLSLGVIAGLLTFIEYLGAIASAAPAMLLAVSRGGLTVLWVALIFTVAHIFEGYVLTPLLSRKMVHMPPAFTLAGQLVLGALFGVMGLTFATPVMVVGVFVVKMLYVEDALGERVDEGKKESAATERRAKDDARAVTHSRLAPKT